MRLLFGAFPVAFLLFFGCSERVPEPLADKKEPAPLADTQSPKAPKKRCIHPTEKEPKRKLESKGPDPRCPPDDLDKPPKLATGKAVFPEAGDTAITIELARTNSERMRGLMYRKSLEDDRGMLFTFEKPSIQRFWMHNTCLPLDMLFIDEEGFVVGIEENTTTMSEATFSVPCPSSYVLEVNAGFCRKHGIRAGQKVVLSGLDAQSP